MVVCDNITVDTIADLQYLTKKCFKIFEKVKIEKAPGGFKLI